MEDEHWMGQTMTLLLIWIHCNFFSRPSIQKSDDASDTWTSDSGREWEWKRSEREQGERERRRERKREKSLGVEWLTATCLVTVSPLMSRWYRQDLFRIKCTILVLYSGLIKEWGRARRGREREQERKREMRGWRRGGSVRNKSTGKMGEYDVSNH